MYGNYGDATPIIICKLRFLEFNENPKILQQMAAKHDNILDAFGMPISQKNEKAVHETLLCFMSEKLETYETTLSEDRQLMQADGDSNYTNCLKLRIHEKEIVNFILKSSYYFIHILDLPFV